jgi:hypothetical protein
VVIEEGNDKIKRHRNDYCVAVYVSISHLVVARLAKQTISRLVTGSQSQQRWRWISMASTSAYPRRYRYFLQITNASKLQTRCIFNDNNLLNVHLLKPYHKGDWFQIKYTRNLHSEPGRIFFRAYKDNECIAMWRIGHLRSYFFILS